MLINQTLETLRKMGLSGMAQAYRHQLEKSDSLALSFEERFSLLVDFEWTARYDRRLSRLRKEAKLRLQACMEDIDYQYPRGLDRNVILSLKSCNWLRSHQGILITGPTGVGKSFLACAFGNAACRMGFKVRYYRLAQLFSELGMAKADGTHTRLLHSIGGLDLLILDDWGLAPFTQSEGHELLNIVEERYQSGSMIITSQLPIDLWHGAFSDPTVADAVLDRIVHNSHKLNMQGESMRKIIKSQITLDTPEE